MQTIAEGVCNIPKKITYSYDKESDVAELGAKALASFAKECEYSEEDAFIKFNFDESLEDKKELYCIEISSSNSLKSFVGVFLSLIIVSLC